MALTYKQRAFVEHYLGDAQWNATEAARMAGYKGRRTTLAVVGSNNLRKPNIRAHIRRRLEEMGANTEALVRRWLARSQVDISPFVTKDGLDVEKLKEAGLGYLIKGVRKTKDATTIALRDPDVAEERLARHLGMFVERRVLSGPGGGPIETKDATPDISGLTNEELDRLAELARRIQANKPAEGA